MPDSSHQRYSHKMFEPAPWTISESNHCATVFEKLRLQREQGRFCDVILKVNGREFPAHRCVLASCSSVFDRKFNVHKTMKESVEVENVKNYEVFHLVLTYMYTGKISLEKQTVADILDIAHLYSINKLKNYCSEFLERYLRLNNCLKVSELSTRYHLVDLSKQTMSFILKNFKQILQYNELDKKPSLEEFLSYHQSFWLPAEIVLRLIMRWISQDQERREEQFVSLLNNVNWNTGLDQTYLTSLLDDFKLGQESYLTLLSTLIKNNVPLEDRFNKTYQDLQERFFSNCHDFEQELDDNNSFLSFAIKTAVKDLENQEVDETFSSYILQQETGLTETVPQYNYRSHQTPDIGYEAAMVDGSGLIGMESSYVTSNTVHETNIQGKSVSKVEHSETGEYMTGDETLKTPLRVSTSYTDQPSSMMFPGSKMMMTPDNSAASSPIAQSIPSPVNTYKPMVVGQPAEYSYRGVEMYQPGPSMYRDEQEMFRVQHPTYANMENYRSNAWLGESDSGLQRPDYSHSQHYRAMEQARHDNRNINKQGFDFISEYQMIEQVINEQEENTKYPATKRYDPKHRALAQAFRKKDPSQETENYFSVKHQHMEACSINKSEQQIHFDPISQQESDPCQYSRTSLSSRGHSRPDLPSSSSFIEAGPATPDHLSSCAGQEPLQTPEKSEFYQSPSCITPEETEQTRSKPEPQQLFLTPKEKYAKEVSAQNQNYPQPQPIVTFDLNQSLDTEKASAPTSASSEQKTVEAKTVFPSAIKILKSKKKMASQKRLILEHGEVRLTQRQRIKMKKKSRRLRAKDIFQPSEEPAVSYPGYGEETVDTDSQNAEDSPKKIIVNRKDKLLAEHRSQNQTRVSPDPELESNVKNTIKCSKCSFSCSTPHKLKVHEKVHKENKQYSCPFCSYKCYWIKDHYHHIQVSLLIAVSRHDSSSSDQTHARPSSVQVSAVRLSELPGPAGPGSPDLSLGDLALQLPAREL